MTKSKKKSSVVANKITKTGKTIKTEMGSFLADKPMWVWWIAYILIIGVIFLAAYAALTVLKIWWITVPLILIIGLIWGTLSFNRHNRQDLKKVVKK